MKEKTNELNSVNEILLSEVGEKLRLVKYLHLFKKSFEENKDSIDVKFYLKQYDWLILRMWYIKDEKTYYLNLSDETKNEVLFAIDWANIDDILSSFKSFIILNLQNENINN